jgi:hypothetical protein
MANPLISRRPAERAQAWLWTGPLGHLYGGLTDFVVLLARIAGARARAAIGRPAKGR